MKKTNVLWIMLNSIFLILFNTFFFLLGEAEPRAAVWVSYGFIHFAYLMLIISPALIRKGKSRAVFGFTVHSISTAHFLVQFLAGVILMFIPFDSINAPLLTQMSIAGLYGIILIANIMANERTAEAEEVRQHQVSYIKDSAIRLKTVLDRVHDKAAKKKVERLYDALYSSPVKSHPGLAQIEEQIIRSVGELERAAHGGNPEAVATLADSALGAVNERNMQLRTFN